MKPIRTASIRERPVHPEASIRERPSLGRGVMVGPSLTVGVLNGDWTVTYDPNRDRKGAANASSVARKGSDQTSTIHA